MEWNAEYKELMRMFLAEKGRAVEFSKNSSFDWDRVSPYGWSDYAAEHHIHPYNSDDTCEWVVPEGAVVQEQTYSMFNGTFEDNKDEVGLNVSGCRCRCGKFTDMTLRYVGSMEDVLKYLFGVENPTALTL